jgi:dipeptide transport system substrate-binding protein
MAEPNPADIPTLMKIAKLKVLDREGMNVGYLAFNTSKKPFDNSDVRKAIMHALNRENYISAVYLGNATLAKNPIPPSMWSYNEGVKDHEYNPEKAKEFLKKAGLPNGFETELWTLPVSRPYNPAGKKMGELMQADLAKVGIIVKLATFDWPTYLERSRKGEHQMIQLGWTGDNGDPDNFLNILLGCSAVKSGSNVSRWCHQPFNELIQQAKINTDQKRRTDLYMKAQEIFKAESPWVPLAHGRVYRAMSSRVEGFSIHPLGRDVFTRVQLKD